jgi:hypothetical protein
MSAAVDTFSSPPAQLKQSADLPVAPNSTTPTCVSSRSSVSKPTSELSSSVSARASKSEFIASSNMSAESVLNRSNGKLVGSVVCILKLIFARLVLGYNFYCW